MEEKEYFYLNGETKVGPLSLAALKGTSIQPDTMVWNNSLPDWVEARSLPELQGLFVTSPIAEPAPSQPTPPPASPIQTENFGGNTFNNNPNATPPMPDNNLVWAILSTVLCCWPIGIASIVNAAKVSSTYMAGDYAGAVKAAENAKKFAIWSAVGAAIFWILYILFIVVLGVAGALY